MFRRDDRRDTRRGGSVGFIPTSITGARVWLPKPSSDKVILSASDVTTWLNQIPAYTHDATQAVAGKKPDHSFSSLNGQPGITFDGADDCLRIPTLDLDSSTQVTVAVVAKDTSAVLSVIYEMAAGGGGAGTCIVALQPLGAAGTLRTYLEGSFAASSGFAAETLTNVHRIICTADISIVGAPGVFEIAMWIDGVAQTLTQDNSGNVTGVFPDQAFNLGARNDGALLAWAGTLGEVLVYDRVLTATEISQLDTYLKNNWGL